MNDTLYQLTPELTEAVRALAAAILTDLPTDWAVIPAWHARTYEAREAAIQAGGARLIWTPSNSAPNMLIARTRKGEYRDGAWLSEVRGYAAAVLS